MNKQHQGGKNFSVAPMLNRKFQRERREYLERLRSEEQRAKSRRRREALLNAYERDVVVPKELRENEGGRGEDAIEDLVYAHEADEKEDEYSSGAEPKILITTSRSPSSSLVRFAKSLKFIFPNAQKINRGKHAVRELADMARENGYTDLLMVSEHKGAPSSLIVSHLPHGPTAYFSLHHVVAKKGAEEGPGSLSTSAPGIIFENFASPLGARVKRILSGLFPPLAKRAKPRKVASFVNHEDFILFRQCLVSASGGEVELEKISPEFDMRLYEIRAATLEVDYLDKEYVFRPYLNTARKKLYL